MDMPLKPRIPFVNIVLVSLMRFLIQYRRTAVGPLWTVIGPLLFVFVVGGLYASIMKADKAYFIPYMTIGFITWSLINMLLTQSLTVYQRGRAQVLQNKDAKSFLVYENVVSCLILFCHQALVIVMVLMFYQVPITFYWLASIFGIAVISLNGVWVGEALGILGARYRDLSEMMSSILRLAFLATPIIWVPSSSMVGGIAGHVLNWNPFYHFLEIVRAPIVDHNLAPKSWLIVVLITLAGFAFSNVMKVRYARFIPLWI